MKVLRMHDYMAYAPKDAKPNVPALRRIMISFFVVTALAFGACMFVVGRDIGLTSHPAAHTATIHTCNCKGQCIRPQDALPNKPFPVRSDGE
jgi:hypothetical protein